MCAYLTGKQYWADFIDPSSGRPYYGPHTADTLFETDERYRYFGINIVDLGCCRVVEHLQHDFMEDLAKALTDYHDPRIDLVYKQHLHEQLNRFLIDPNSWQIALATFQQQ
ncbi:unnamed protein product, partial [Rotaria magnacalcarata]